MSSESNSKSVFHGSLRENLLKGIFFGSAASVSFRHADAINCLLGPLLSFASAIVVALVISRFSHALQGRRSNLFAILLTALEHAVLICAFATIGLIGGRIYSGENWQNVFACAAGGAILGAAIHLTRRFTNHWIQLIVGAAIPIAVGCAIAAADLLDSWTPVTGPFLFLDLTLCTVLLTILVLIGEAEESDAEIGLICAGSAAALASLNLSGMGRGVVVLVPIAIYVLYFTKMRSAMIAVKHVLRALDRERLGEKTSALEHFQRAAEISPTMTSAEEGKWRIHKNLSLADFANDERLSELVDPRLCLERAKRLIAQARENPAVADEAIALLQIAMNRRQDYRLSSEHEKIRLFLELDRINDAVKAATPIFDLAPPVLEHLPENEADAVFKTWILGLSHPQFPRPNFRTDLNPQLLLNAIAVVESRLGRSPVDKDAAEIKNYLYTQLTAAHLQLVPTNDETEPITWLDYKFCRNMAQGLVQDPQAFPRAIELLTIAQKGLPDERLSLFHSIAQLCENRGDLAQADRWRESIIQIGMKVGPKLLASSEQDVFYKTARNFAEKAYRESRLEEAIRFYQIYAQSPASGIDTLRTLMTLCEEQKDTLGAIRYVEHAFSYSFSDQTRKRWLADKYRLYGSVELEDARRRWQEVSAYFDAAFCLDRAEELLEAKRAKAEILHYLNLAQLAGEPLALRRHFLMGRLHQREGDLEGAMRHFKEAMTRRPAKNAKQPEEQAFFVSCRLRGDLALYSMQDPAVAIECYEIYKDYMKSGADTLLKLAQAYEQLGQFAKARKWYDMVLVYPGHPAAETARESLKRIAAPT